MKFDLTSMAKRQTSLRRKSVLIRDIAPPSVLATDLYQAGYKPVIDLWRRYAERVIAEYERTLSSLITDAPADISSTLDQADGEFQRLALLLRPAMRDWTVRLERFIRGKWTSAVLASTKVDLSMLIGPADAVQTLEQTLEWNVNLVADVSAQAKQRISAAVFDGLRNVKPAREVAKDIRGAVDMARDRSIRIASHQMSSLSSVLTDERRRQAGIDGWEWVHSQKRHPRAEHLARNGHIYSDNPSDVGRTVNGKTFETPPAQRPGIEPNCGCRARAYLVFGDE